MVLGIDESLKNLTDYIFKYLPSHIDNNSHDDIDDSYSNSSSNNTKDSSIFNTNVVKNHRYSNTIMIVLSDNGGSPWFGGLNSPLKGTKGNV